jgi:hypothetical protein
MVVSRQNVTDNRTDISRFMVHLTRDDRDQENGQPARANFESILAIGKSSLSGRTACMRSRFQTTGATDSR